MSAVDFLSNLNLTKTETADIKTILKIIKMVVSFPGIINFVHDLGAEVNG